MTIDEIIIELFRIRSECQRKASESAIQGQQTYFAQNMITAERISSAILILDRAKPHS